MILAVLFLGGGPIVFDAQGQTGESLTQARQSVAEFESSMMQQLLAAKNDEELRDSETFRGAIRVFFAGLDDSAMRLAAVDLLDRRYVYIVNRDLAAELLGALIRDAEPIVRVRAAKAIGYNECGAQYVDELIAMLDGKPSIETLVNVAYAMGRSGHQPFVKHLEELAGHADARVRSTASFELTRLAPQQAFNHNLRLLNDGQPSVRRAAIQNISRCPEGRSIMRLERMLNDKDGSVRERAVWALGQLHADDSADAVAMLLSDADHHVRARAALVLGQMHANRHAQRIAGLLTDQDVVVRRYASQAMGAMGLPRYIEKLRPLLNDTDDQVRNYAAMAIEQLEMGKSGGEQSHELEPAAGPHSDRKPLPPAQ